MLGVAEGATPPLRAAHSPGSNWAVDRRPRQALRRPIVPRCLDDVRQHVQYSIYLLEIKRLTAKDDPPSPHGRQVQLVVFFLFFLSRFILLRCSVVVRSRGKMY